MKFITDKNNDNQMKKIYKYLMMGICCVLVATGCRKGFEEINTNPATYNPETFDPNFLLTSAQLGYAGSTDLAYDTWRGNLIYCATMTQGLSSVISYWAGDKYMLNAGYTAAYWGFSADVPTAGVGAYPEQVRPIVDVVRTTKDKQQYRNLHQVARIMRAMIFQRLTDLYGDVPYSQAGVGYYEKNYFPVYDAQQAIYADMLKEVDEAVTALDVNGDKPAGDAYFGGDIGKWKRFGGSLMLRMAMRLSKVDPATAQSYAQKAIGKTMAGNADNAFLKGDAKGGRATNNRNSQILLGDGGNENFYVRWSKTFIDYLKSTNDPRLGVIAVTNLYTDDVTKDQNAAADASPAVQKGMPNGKDLSTTAGLGISLAPGYTRMQDYSSPSPVMIMRDAPAFVMTYAESEFLLAEAAQRFNIGGSASTHYRNGLINAITYLAQYGAAAAVSETVAANYADAHPYVAANGLSMISWQYWALMNTKLDFYESWSNWRRTGYPELVPVVYPGNATNGTIPRRFPYPISEAGSNTANYNAASKAVPGGDLLTSRVWWDKN